MKTRPILFSAPMVRAILDGSKTQTRRVVKAKHIPFISGILGGLLDGRWNQRPLPYGQIGDRLWVRETWQYYDWDEEGRPLIRFAADNQTTQPNLTKVQIEWLDGIWRELSKQSTNIDNRIRDKKWRPSIFMPRWASRITLEITGVRVERLNDISVGDVDREGTPANYPSGASKDDYAALWESINGKGSWDVNPWVWVIEFKRVAA